MQHSPDDSHATRRTLWSKPSSRWWLGIPLGGLLMLVLGVVLANGFSFVMHATSSPEFCATACHYMRDFVAPEVANSVHGRNGAGVAATCPACHVPQPFLAKTKRKIEAAREGWGHVTGIISTRDKFEAHKLRMAERVWAEMEANGSRECRSCHNFATMDFDEQGRMAARRHQAAAKAGQSCIDCHKGIAHSLPSGYDESARETEKAASATPAAAGGVVHSG
jgi:nitrate/TMAO reductase-like tetraheme cytochrome c subunit